MRRRRFLASGTAFLSVALAGCGHPSVILDLNEATADDIADEVSMTADPGSEEYESSSRRRSKTGRPPVADGTSCSNPPTPFGSTRPSTRSRRRGSRAAR